MTSEDGLILWKLLAAHLLTDFVFQPKAWVQQKNARHYKSGWLNLHGLIAGVLTYLVLWNREQWAIPLLIMGTHIGIDIWKSYRKDSLAFFLLDQILHILILLLSWLWIVHGWQPFQLQAEGYLTDFHVWVIASSYLMVVFPFGILIGKATSRWSDQLHNSGLVEAGKWIGIFERVIILTLLLVNQYEAIGLLIAAKSILRFPEKEEQDPLKRTEYVLIGTLLSFGLTFLLSLLIKALIAQTTNA